MFVDYFYQYIGKRKAGSSTRKRLRKLHTSEYKNSCFTKKKLFFISKKIQLIQRSNNQQCHPLHLGSKQYKQLPQKKISKKGKGKRRRESANEREKEKEKKKKEEKGKEEKKKEEKMERAVLKFFFF